MGRIFGFETEGFNIKQKFCRGYRCLESFGKTGLSLWVQLEDNGPSSPVNY